MPIARESSHSTGARGECFTCNSIHEDFWFFFFPQNQPILQFCNFAIGEHPSSTTRVAASPVLLLEKSGGQLPARTQTYCTMLPPHPLLLCDFFATKFSAFVAWVSALSAPNSLTHSSQNWHVSTNSAILKSLKVYVSIITRSSNKS